MPLPLLGALAGGGGGMQVSGGEQKSQSGDASNREILGDLGLTSPGLRGFQNTFAARGANASGDASGDAGGGNLATWVALGALGLVVFLKRR